MKLGRRKTVELETWERWGGQAKSLRLRLMRLAGEVGNRVGKTKRATRLLERAQRNLELARCLMDGEYFHQHPTKGHNTLLLWT